MRHLIKKNSSYHNHFRQLSGGNYYIAVEQVLSSLQLQRLKLYDKLAIDDPSPCPGLKCCDSDLTDHELEALDDSFSEGSYLSAEESSALYYACGYVAYKMGGCYASPEVSVDDVPESEFTDLLSRGKLSYPSDSLFAFAVNCFYVFKTVTSELSDNSKCSSRTIHLFSCLLDVFPNDFDTRKSEVCKRLANIFYKGLVKQIAST